MGMKVELVRTVEAPGRSGPTNGMYALQKALIRRIASNGLPWLSIVREHSRRADVLPWFWHWGDRAAAVAWGAKRPFVEGPNMLFIQSRTPRVDPNERGLLDSPGCRTMFCHTPWYRDLIARHKGPDNRAPIVLWPYPIDPAPEPPLPAHHDLLVYDKSKGTAAGPLLSTLRTTFPSHVVLRYGDYDRARLFDVARRSRACAYVTDNDHGPLALQEILLSGCPTVGVRTGASFVKDGETGFLLPRLAIGPHANDRDDIGRFVAEIQRALRLDRSAVRASAAKLFDTSAIIDSIVKSLDVARRT